MKTVLVATSTSQNKLKAAVDYIDNYMKNKQIEVVIVGRSIYDADLEEVKPAVIVAIGPHNFGSDIPIVDGIPFITKIGMDQCCDEIICHLQS